MTGRRSRPVGKAISLKEMLEAVACDQAWAQAFLEQTRARLAYNWVRRRPRKVKDKRGTG